mgnify:CR=1 FL=1
MVFENQTDLIAENAVLKSRLAGTRLQRFADAQLSGLASLDALSRDRRAALEREARQLGVSSLRIYDDEGRIYASIGEDASPENASPLELRRIHQALTRRDFENRLFHHELDMARRRIALYIPFDYGEARVAVGAAMLPLPAVDRNLRFLYRQSLVMAGLVVALHLFFAALIGRMVLVPLRDLGRAIAQVSAGELQTEIPVRREDEIGHLAATFNHMSRNLQNMREEARGANPLTGLPGNVRIATLIDAYLYEGRRFAVVYADLDNFKAYNDTYGFSRGDSVILYLRDCLLAAGESVSGEFFVGHEGGDDFLVICDEARWHAYVEELVRSFDAGVGPFYSDPDRTRGYIEALDRQGRAQQFPLVAVSVAVVRAGEGRFSHHAEMITIAADVKKAAKQIEGSAWVLERRSVEAGEEDTAVPESEKMKAGGSKAT